MQCGSNITLHTSAAQVWHEPRPPHRARGEQGPDAACILGCGLLRGSAFIQVELKVKNCHPSPVRSAI
eukprot:5342632-Prymnesium_polylepis.1